MNELIWVGNSLYPRGLVFTVVGIILIVICGVLAVLGDKK